MTRLYIAEQNALTTGGHYYAYTKCIADAAVDKGLDVVILHNERFLDEWQIAKAVTRRAFALTWGEAELGVGRRWGAGNIAYDFVKATRQMPPRVGDHVLFHTIGFAELACLLDHFTSLTVRADLAHYHILLRYDPGQMRDDIATYRPLFRRLAASPMLRRHIHFHSDTEQLAHAYERLTLLPFSVLPIPFNQDYLAKSLRAHARVADAPLKIAYIGDARLEKGFGLLPAAIAELQNHRPGKLLVQFGIQSNFNVAGGEVGMIEARDALGLMRDVELIPDCLDTRDYYDRLAAANAIVVPYDAERYAARSSGILIEALAAGKPVVTTAGSWMESQVSASHAVVFGNGRSLGSALIELVDNYETLAWQAETLAAEWRVKASGTNFLERLLASAKPEPRTRGQGARILVVMNGDAMVLRNGASRVALAQFAYLQAAGYRVCGFFIAHAPEAISGSLDQWMRDLSERLSGFDLEAAFVAAPGRLAIEQWRHSPDFGPSIEADLEVHRHLDVSAGLLGYLRRHPVDAVLLNYVTAYPVVEAMALADRPVICEMHDLQALQKGIYGRRLVSPRDIEAELAVLARCAHLVSLNPDEAAFVADRLPDVPISVTGVFPGPPKSVTEVLAGCRDLIDVVASAKPSGDPATLHDSLAQFDGIDMLFVGSNHWPNLQGLRWFLDEVFFPHLAKHRTTLVVAGSVTEGGEWPVSPFIVYLGRVGDLAPLYAAARIALLPILEGGGSSVKTAEALVHGVPIVATSSALRGLDQVAWQGVVIADDPDDYGRAILDLLGDAARRQHIGRAARNMAAVGGGGSRYDEVMNDVFRQVLGKEAAAVTRESVMPADSNDASFEWNDKIAAANSIVRDWLDDAVFDPRALRVLMSAPPSEAGALVETFVKTLLIDQTAALLDSNDDLLKRVVQPGVAEEAGQIGLFVAAARASGGAVRTSRKTTILVSSAHEDLTIRAVAPSASEASIAREPVLVQVLRAARSTPYCLAAREISLPSREGSFEAEQWLRFDRVRLILGEPMVDGGRILPDGTLEIPGNETVTLVLPALMEPGMRELAFEFASRHANTGRLEFAHDARKLCLTPILTPRGSSYIEVLAASGRDMPFAPWRVSLHALDGTVHLDGIAMRVRFFGASFQ